MRILPALFATFLLTLASAVRLRADDPSGGGDSGGAITNNGTIFLSGIDPNSIATSIFGATFDVNVNTSLDGTTNTTTVLDGLLRVGSDPNAAAVTVTGGTLNLTGITPSNGTVTLTGGTLNLTGTDPITGSLTATVTGGALVFNAATPPDAGGLTIIGAGILNLNNGAISNGAVTFINPATGLVLSGLNTFPGTLGVTATTITVGNFPTYLTGPFSTGGTLFVNGPLTQTIGIGTLNISAANLLTIHNVYLSAGAPLVISTTPGQTLNVIPAIHGNNFTLNTTASFLDGVTSNSGTVSLLYLTSILNLATNPLEVHMSEFDTGTHDKYVLQMSYDPATAAALGDLSKLYLAWYDPADGVWKNAVDGNSDGGASATFVNGAYDPTVDFNLGYYGIDTVHNEVWAVVDHNSTFGVANQDLQPQGVPEPTSAALLALGMAVSVQRLRRRRA